MDPNELKEEFGDRITFWGGCFVFSQVHNILSNVPPENVVAMFDTAYANSFY